MAPLDVGDANLRRARLMLAALINHPSLIPDVEEVFSQVSLPPAEAQLRDALNSFAADEKSLDSKNLFTHLSELGLDDAAERILALAAQDHRPDPNASLAEVAEKWWSWYILMDFSIELLRSQRDEAKFFGKLIKTMPALGRGLLNITSFCARLPPASLPRRKADYIGGNFLAHPQNSDVNQHKNPGVPPDHGNQTRRRHR